MSDIQRFSDYYKLGKSQYELDFVDVPINRGDVPLFIDPYVISKRPDLWSFECHNMIVSYFQEIVNSIRGNREDDTMRLLDGLHEPNQTRFGLSVGENPRGRGIGRGQARFLYFALSESTAVRTGFIKDLEECELLIEGIGRDKISDITTNIIRHKLIEYTQEQCDLLGVPVRRVTGGGAIWDRENKEWKEEYTDLPMCHGKSIILVPRSIARRSTELDNAEYYRHFVLEHIQREHLSANSSLVRTLKGGIKRPPYKKDLEKMHPNSKRYLYEFSKENPEVLQRYKESKNIQLIDMPIEKLIEVIHGNENNESLNTSIVSAELIKRLDRISVGFSNAEIFHKLVAGVLTFVFSPSLIHPIKEAEIHEGRKRIDIVFKNAAREGFFFNLPNGRDIPSAYVFVECKNYSSDPTNPELDQLSGRFGVNRGKIGFLVCRKFQNKHTFIKRCRDTAQDGRGFIIPLDDEDLKTLIRHRERENFQLISSFLEGRFQNLV